MEVASVEEAVVVVDEEKVTPRLLATKTLHPQTKLLPIQ